MSGGHRGKGAGGGLGFKPHRHTPTHANHHQTAKVHPVLLPLLHHFICFICFICYISI